MVLTHFVVKIYNGTNWIAVGNKYFSSEIFGLSLYVYNDTPYVAYTDLVITDKKASVMKFSN